MSVWTCQCGVVNDKGRTCEICGRDRAQTVLSAPAIPSTYRTLSGPPLSREQNLECKRIFDAVSEKRMRRQRGCSMITWLAESWGMPAETLRDPSYVMVHGQLIQQAPYNLTEKDWWILDRARVLRDGTRTVDEAFAQAERDAPDGA